MQPIDGSLLDGMSDQLRAAHGMPSDGSLEADEQAVASLVTALEDVVHADGLRTSPLCPGWSRHFDLYVQRQPDPTRLRRLGWISAGPLLARLGRPGEDLWARLGDDGRVTASVRLHRRPPPDPVVALLDRCRANGRVRLREVLELRELIRLGYDVPLRDPVVRSAARIEAGVGGDLLSDGAVGSPTTDPIATVGRMTTVARRVAQARLRPPLVVAFSGMDGAGKSTLSGRLADNLHDLGISTALIWYRIGLRGKWLERVATSGRRLYRHVREDVSEQVSRERGVPTGVARRGVVGWVWMTTITTSFLANIYRQYLGSWNRDVLLFDRHAVDSLVTLDVMYEDADARMQRAAIVKALPAPSLTVYVDVPPHVSRARKPDDIFAVQALERQRQSYRRHIADFPGIRLLDGTRSIGELTAAVTKIVLGS